MQADIRTALVDRLAAIFGRPKDAAGLTLELARHLPAWGTSEGLAGLADRIIATRKAKGFPPASELIAGVRALPHPSPASPAGQADALARWRADDEREAAALAMLQGTPLAMRACSEGWGPGLIAYVAEHGCEPDGRDERIIAQRSRANDRDASEATGAVGGMLRQLREEMHRSAARRLGLREM